MKTALNETHRDAGGLVLQLTQLHSAMQIKLIWFRYEAEHVKAVANRMALPVSSRLLIVYVDERHRLIIRTPKKNKT